MFQCPPPCQTQKDGFKRTKLLSKLKTKWTSMDVFPPVFQFPLLTFHWAPSCWSPLQKWALPPWAGYTETTRTIR